MHIADLYQSVTNGIIADLEKGTASWTKPWKDGKTVGLMPANAATGRPYSGINIPILWFAADARGFPTHGWMTFKQAIDLGANVRQGEKGTAVVFTKKLTVKDEAEEERLVPMLRAFTVFNVAQIDGLPEPPPALPTPPPGGAVQIFIDATKAEIRIGGNKACYVPSLDFVALPSRSAFKNPESYFATALHECAHWSGHEKRLNRDLNNRFGSQAYAAEELVAELTAAFLCAHLGITGELRHADYIADWIALLKDDNRAIFTAASRASQAADYLRAFSETGDAEQPERNRVSDVPADEARQEEAL